MIYCSVSVPPNRSRQVNPVNITPHNCCFNTGMQWNGHKLLTPAAQPYKRCRDDFDVEEGIRRVGMQ